MPLQSRQELNVKNISENVSTQLPHSAIVERDAKALTVNAHWWLAPYKYRCVA